MAANFRNFGGEIGRIAVEGAVRAGGGGGDVLGASTSSGGTTGGGGGVGGSTLSKGYKKKYKGQG